MNGLHNARTIRDIAGTLVHEMVHFWQWKWGARYPKSCSHNQEWADKMVSLGLTPICTDKKAKPGQKTGKNCTHEIVDGGKFDVAFSKLPEELKMPWVGLKFSKKKTSTKKTYECACGKTIYSGKEISRIGCLDCKTEFKKVLTEDEQAELEAKREEAEAEAEERESRRIDGWDDGERRNPELDDLFGDDEHEIIKMKPKQPDRWNADLDNIFG